MYILIIYYSGVGNTKLVAHKIFRMLKTKCEVDIISIEHMSHIISLEKYDAFVIGFPTIHASPAIPITEFIEKLMPLHSKKPSLIFTTCGLYSANTLRIFSKKCVIKNILPIITASYRCSATDGMLIAPYMNVWFRHDKKLDEKIEKSINDFLYLLKGTIKYRLPRFKIYSILNYPNKYLGEKLVSRIYIHNTYCTLCKKCIKSCPAKAINENIEGYPIIDRMKCIHCYRCIHHCPQKALSLSKRKRPQRTVSDTIGIVK